MTLDVFLHWCVKNHLALLEGYDPQANVPVPTKLPIIDRYGFVMSDTQGQEDDLDANDGREKALVRNGGGQFDSNAKETLVQSEDEDESGRKEEKEVERLRKEEVERALTEEGRALKAEEDRLRKEEEDRLRKEEEDRLRKEDEERLRKEEEERLRKEEEERLRKEEEERLRKEEEERLRKEEEERLRKEEEERLRKEENERVRKEEEMRARKEEEMRLRLEEKMRLQEEEEMRFRQEEEDLQLVEEVRKLAELLAHDQTKQGEQAIEAADDAAVAHESPSLGNEGECTRILASEPMHAEDVAVCEFEPKASEASGGPEPSGSSFWLSRSLRWLAIQVFGTFRLHIVAGLLATTWALFRPFLLDQAERWLFQTETSQRGSMDEDEELYANYDEYADSDFDAAAESEAGAHDDDEQDVAEAEEAEEDWENVSETELAHEAEGLLEEEQLVSGGTRLPRAGSSRDLDSEGLYKAVEFVPVRGTPFVRMRHVRRSLRNASQYASPSTPMQFRAGTLMRTQSFASRESQESL